MKYLGMVLAWLGIAFVGILTLSVFAPVEAKDCGDSVACACGDRVVRSYTLTADMVCQRATHGLEIRNTTDIVLDLGAYNIYGIVGSANYGISIDRSQRITVVGGDGALDEKGNFKGTIIGFREGMKIMRSTDISIVGRSVDQPMVLARNGANGKGYGVNITSSTLVDIVDVQLLDNADEGLHVSTSDDLHIERVRAKGQRLEQFYLLNSHDSVMVDCEGQGGSNPMYIKNSSRWTFTRFRSVGATLLIRGDSHDNLFVDLELVGSRFREQATADGTPYNNRRITTH